MFYVLWMWVWVFGLPVGLVRGLGCGMKGWSTATREAWRKRRSSLIVSTSPWRSDWVGGSDIDLDILKQPHSHHVSPLGSPSSPGLIQGKALHQTTFPIHTQPRSQTPSSSFHPRSPYSLAGPYTLRPRSRPRPGFMVSEDDVGPCPIPARFVTALIHTGPTTLQCPVIFHPIFHLTITFIYSPFPHVHQFSSPLLLEYH